MEEAYLVPPTSCLGIALPPSVAHFPSGKKPSVKERKKGRNRESPLVTLTCGLFPLSSGTEQEVKLEKKRLEVRLEV